MKAITNFDAVETYAAQVMEIYGMLENLQEWAATLPAPEEDGTIEGFDYGDLGTIGHIHTLLTEASEAADEHAGE